MKLNKLFIFILFFGFGSLVINTAGSTHAQNVNELKDKINDHTEQIKKLDEEIGKYQQEINAKVEQAKTLQSTIQVIDTNTKKFTTEIKKTEVGISKVNLSLTELASEIAIIEKKVDLNTKAIAETLNNLSKADDISMVEIFLGSGSMAEAFDGYHTADEFHKSMSEKSAELAEYKNELQGKKTDVEDQKKELVGLKVNLGDQKTVLDINKKEKATLLTQTKNKESEYKSIVAQKQAEKEKFEKELFEYESRLKIAIDPNSFASAKKGVIAWPLENIYVTQNFGKTADSHRLYTSGTHNGVDFRAGRGTKVLSVLSGTVQAIGNTDAQRGCYSYGKWILVRHTNGLTSLYAHLDVVSVQSGQTVGTGDIIGYSGQTGYATGPHLHFTLYASQGVRVERYSSSINCKNVDIPIAPSNAYLDPMVYFPTL